MYSKNSLRTRKGWCTRKGHNWPLKWKPINISGKIFHEHKCLRCHAHEYKEPGILSWIVATTFKERQKKAIEALCDQSPLLSALKKHGKL